MLHFVKQEILIRSPDAFLGNFAKVFFRFIYLCCPYFVKSIMYCTFFCKYFPLSTLSSLSLSLSLLSSLSLSLSFSLSLSLSLSIDLSYEQRYANGISIELSEGYLARSNPRFTSPVLCFAGTVRIGDFIELATMQVTVTVGSRKLSVASSIARVVSIVDNIDRREDSTTVLLGIRSPMQ